MWCALAFAAVAAQTELDQALERFWAAPAVAEAEAVIPEVLASGAAFDEIHQRLRAGRPYSRDVRRGTFFTTRSIEGMDHHAMVLVPEQYDPARKWLVRFDLHGGMGQPEWKRADGSWSQGWADVESYRNGHLTIVPAGWWDSMWWEASQVEHFRALLREVKRTYNVDENRVVLVGASDGAIGAWFYAFRHPDPWASYVGFIGFPTRLTNRKLRADGQMHLSNLDGQRFWLVNGGRDRIVNIDVMRGYLELFRERTRVHLDYREYPESGHDLQITPEDEDAFIRFFVEARRDPLPDEISWATERVDRYARRGWLVITEIAPDHPVDESNILPRIYGRNVPRRKPPKPQPWGRVGLVREGNTIHATTVGVKRFQLLLSPAEFEFAQPIRVLVDGRAVVDERITPDPEVLLRWAARDDDRTMLFAAELEVTVPPGEG